MTINNDRGANMVEYGLMVAVVALVSLAAVTLLGEKTDETFTTIAASLEEDSSIGAPGGSNGGSDESEETGGPGGGGNTTPGEETGGNDDTGENPGGNDEGQNPGGNDEGQPLDGDDDQGDENEPGPADDESGDDEGQNPGGDDGAEDEGDEGNTQPGPSSNPSGTSANLTWWNGNKDTGNGAWQASVSYENATDRHQYMKLEVTRVDDKGKVTTTIIDSFYVPANGSSTFSHWDNQFRAQQGKFSGVIEVQVKVLTITTSDKDWQPFSYPVEDRPVKVLPPSPK